MKSLRDNATKRGNAAVATLCETEIARRKPTTIKRPRSEVPVIDREGQYVSEFHFVCPNESEVQNDGSGFIRSGTWVAAETNAEAAVKYGSLIVLHVSKAEPSYLQGKIKNWIKKAREPRNTEGELVKNESGVEFHFEPTSNPLPRKGDGSGEKGYASAQIPDPA